MLGAMVGSVNTSETGMAVFLGILFAILGAWIAFMVYIIGIFSYCGSIGFLLGYILTERVELEIIIAVVIGLIGVFFIKLVIVISTSVSK